MFFKMFNLLFLQNRTLFLQPNQEVKIGRAVARTKPSDTNAIFDCKVLSRNHAIIWYRDGKFFLKVSDIFSFSLVFTISLILL